MASVGQLIGVFFGIFMVLLTWLSHYKKKIKGISAFASYLLWAGWIIGILLFNQIKNFALVIGIQVFDLFVYGAIIVLFVIIFYFYINIKGNQKKIEEIVENVAVREGKNK